MPKRIFFSLLLFSGICFQNYAQTPELAWAKHVGSADGEVGNSITLDDAGNIYVTGEFGGITDFDPGQGQFYMGPSGSRDIFVLKLDPDGRFLWAREIGGSGWDSGNAIHWDAFSDHILVTGFFTGTVDFDPATSTTYPLISNGNDDIFVLKLTTDGDFSWAQSFGGTGEDIGRSIVTDASGNVFATGSFRVGVDFDPGPGTFNLVSAGFEDIFIQKLAADGIFTNAIRVGSTASDWANDIAIDAAGALLLTGRYGTSIYGLAFSGQFDIFLAKHNPNDLNMIWARGFGDNQTDEGLSIASDAASNVYVIGFFEGTIDFDWATGANNLTSSPFNPDVFILKYDVGGNHVWAHKFGGTSLDFGNSIATDASGNVSASGWFANTADFDPSPTATFNLTSSGSYDIFNLSLDNNGNFRWARSAGAEFYQDRAFGIAIDQSGNVYSTGSFISVADFNPTGCEYNLVANGGTDIFIQKLHANPPPVCLAIDQPADATVCRNATVTFTVNASGTTNFTYQWRKQNPITFAYENLANGSEHNGVTTSTLSVTPNAAGLERYLVIVSGDFAGQALSDTINLTVNDLPPGSPEVSTEIISQCASSVTFTASGETDGNYRWFDPSGNLIQGEVNSTYTTPLLTDNTNYSVAFADANECYSTGSIARATLTESIAGWRSPSFEPVANSLGSTSSVDDLILQPDGKFVINGFETGAVEYDVARLLPDGSLDPAFAHASLEQSLFTGRVDQLELQADGKIIIAGRFTDINGTSFGRIARLNDDGTIDNAFNGTGLPGFDDRVIALVLQADGKILAGGTFTTYNATSVGAIARINSDGSLDGTFAAPFEGEVEAIVIQSDGKIIVGGTFSAFDGTPMGGLLRLNADGTIDTGFTPPTGATANTIALQADDKIIIGGPFTLLDGGTHNSIARLNSDGTLDNSFDTGDGFDGTPLSIHVETTGKIVVGGYFQLYNNIPVHFLVRLLPDGTFDPFFSNETGSNSWIMHVQSFATDTLIVAGYFDQWNSEPQNAIALVTSHCIVAPSADDITACALTPFTLTACGGSDGQYRWYTSPTGTAITGETNSTLNIASLPASTTYYVSLHDGTCESTRTPLAITLNTPPAQPVVSVTGNTVLCNDETATLGGPAGFASYLWSTGETASHITVSTAGSYTLRVNSGTCWSTSSSAVDITVNSIVQPVIAVVGSADICAGGTVTLRAPDGFSVYTWSTAETAQEITVITAGSYTVTVGDGQCTSPASQAVDVTVTTIPQPVITVTGVTAICNGENVILTAPSGFSSYAWSSGETTAEITVSAPGSYAVQVGDGQCTSAASEAVDVTLSTACNVPPAITSINVETSINGSASIDLAALLSDPDNNIDFSTLRIVSGPLSGASASIDPKQNLLIDYSGVSFSGTDQITIEVCDLANACVQQVITIEVIGDIIVYNAISPNGDNLNDQWIIRYIDIIPGTRSNTVTIYNRWGDVLWTGTNYNNGSVVFRGTNNNGNEIPTGTYFYKIELGNGRVETGFLALKR